MKKVIISFIEGKIEELERAYAQNYVAIKELESVDESKRTAKQTADIGACKFNMERAEDKISWYKKLLKSESKPTK